MFQIPRSSAWLVGPAVLITSVVLFAWTAVPGFSGTLNAEGVSPSHHPVRPTTAYPPGFFCPVQAASHGSFTFAMDTQSDYCATIGPPAGTPTNLAWLTTAAGANVSFYVNAVCLAVAGCITGIVGDHQVYAQSGDRGSTEFMDPTGLWFQMSVSWNGPCPTNSMGEGCQSMNTTVVVSGSWT